MQTIVVGTDGSANAEAAVGRAIAEAKAEGAVLHVVTTYPNVATFSEGITSSAKRDPINLRDVAEGVLARAEGEAEAQGVKVVTDAREGDPAKVILDVAQEQDADLIVIGARGLTGFPRFLLGS